MKCHLLVSRTVCVLVVLIVFLVIMIYMLNDNRPTLKHTETTYQKLKQGSIPLDRLVGKFQHESGDTQLPIFDSESHPKDNDTIAKILEQRVSILCFVLTSPENLFTKAIHVKVTWGTRCDRLLFMSSESDPDLPAIGLNVSEGRDHLTAKSRYAFQYLVTHHLHDVDWFLKADDDTYMIMENLRHFLANKDPSEAVHYGYKMTESGEVYPSGGGGYVLSREALKRLGSKPPSWLRISFSCWPPDTGAEDMMISKCLQKLGVKFINAVDTDAERSRFHAFPLHEHLLGTFASPQWDKHQLKMSDYPISFHYISPEWMYLMEYFLYHVRVFGLEKKDRPINMGTIDTALGDLE